jgi:hypothetical protein
MKIRIVSLVLSATCALLGTSGCIRIESKSAAAERRHQADTDKKMASVTEFRSKIAAASCDTVVATYRTNESRMEQFGSPTAKDTRVALAKKFIECKKGAELFSCVGNIMGATFNDAEKEGVDVMGSLKGYLASSDRKGIFVSDACPGDQGYSLRATFEWLRNRKQDNLCADFIHAMENADANARATIVNYYLIAKKCDGGAKLAIKGLQADEVWAKEATCTYLGKYGDASQIGDIETVAKAHTERILLDDGHEVVPVHDICMQAAASLRLKKNEGSGTASAKASK